MNSKCTKICILFGFLVSCSQQQKMDTTYWQGPHPTDIHKKFVINITQKKDSVFAEGYWTFNTFYDSEFEVENCQLLNDSIAFFVPNWNCTYLGRFETKTNVVGGFQCPGEAIDTVLLTQNNDAAYYLTFPKKQSQNPGWKYTYQVPTPSAPFLKVDKLPKNELLFVESLVSEIIQKYYGRINSILIAKDNRLLCEEYFYGYTRNDIHQIESCTKSITSLLIGIAWDKGFITNLKEPLYQIFPELAFLKKGDYKKLNLWHLLTMSAGFEVNDNALITAENRVDYALKRKLISIPGEKFAYDGGCTEILGAVIQRKTTFFSDDFAKKYLFDPLDIKKYNWDVFSNNNFPCMAGSLELLPVDMLKIGQLILQKGVYKNNQIISEEWLEKSTTEKIKTNITNDNYSFQWWNIEFETPTKKHPVIWANGWGSQFIYVIPDLNAVIVCTGFNYENDSWAISNGIEKLLHLLEEEQR